MGASVVVAVVSGVASFAAQRKQARAAKKERKAREREAAEQRRQNDIRAQRERTQQVRELRRRNATVQNAAAVSGLSAASSTIGGVGSTQSEAGGNIDFINTIQDSNNSITAARQGQADARADQQFYGGVSNLAAQAFANSGQIGDFFEGSINNQSDLPPGTTTEF